MKLTYLLGLLTIISCATPPATERVIEPTITPDRGGRGPGDEGFVLSRKPQSADANGAAEFPIHVEEKWWPFRAEYLTLDVPAAKRRDSEISMKVAPAQFWDEQTAVEAVSIWSALCNECHGGRRRLKDALNMPPPPPNWGRTEGLFFGKRRPYEAIFSTIYNGGPIRDGKESEMPVWRDRLSREMIWSLIYFLEYQSGGIEGQFPPSLYPRQSGEN